MPFTVKRGGMYYADLSPVVGSEQNGFRPVLILSNDTSNRHSPTVVVAALLQARRINGIIQVYEWH